MVHRLLDNVSSKITNFASQCIIINPWFTFTKSITYESNLSVLSHFLNEGVICFQLFLEEQFAKMRPLCRGVSVGQCKTSRALESRLKKHENVYWLVLQDEWHFLGVWNNRLDNLTIEFEAEIGDGWTQRSR